MKYMLHARQIGEGAGASFAKVICVHNLVMGAFFSAFPDQYYTYLLQMI